MNLLSIKEIQDRYRVSKATILNWIRLGGISVHYEANGIMVSLEELEEFKNSRLMGRRNKGNVNKSFIPANYVKDPTLTVLVRKILIIRNSYKVEEQGKILLIIILRLLENRGLLEVNRCIWEKEAIPSNLRGSINPLWDSCSFSNSDQEFIKQLLDLDIPDTAEDFLGFLYLSLRSESLNNKMGSFYTPIEIVDDIVQRTLGKFNTIPKILDPTCGSGIFLLSSFKFLLSKFGVDKQKDIIDNLYGFDIDPLAVVICRINLFLASGYLSDCISQRNSLIDNERNDYDIVIGNPPWGYKFTQKERKDLRFPSEVKESSVLFTLKGLDFVKDNGIISFCLPYSILNVKIHQYIRQKLFHHFTVISITDLGTPFDGVYTGSINLIVKKKNNSVYTVKIANKNGEALIEKGEILSMPFLNVNINMMDGGYKILKEITAIDSFFLKDNCKFALGLVTGNNEKYILNYKSEDTEPIVKGKDVYKFKVKKDLANIKFRPNLYQQLAPIEYYRAPEKIIYRFINKHLTFAYDNRQYLTLNSANILIPTFDSLDIKYILAILNSSAIQFYFQNVFSSVKVLRHQIESFPIPNPSLKEHENIVDMVNNYITLDNKCHLHQAFKEIDEEIFKIFKLSSKDIKMIKEQVEIKNLS